MTAESARLCPQCGGELECDMVDIGVGEMQVGPWGCPACHWFEGKGDEDLKAESEP